MDAIFFSPRNIQVLARAIEAEVQKTTRTGYVFDVPPEKLAARMANLAETYPHLLESRYGARQLNAMLVKQAAEALTTDGADQYMYGLLQSDRKVRGLGSPDEAATSAITLTPIHAKEYEKLIAGDQQIMHTVISNDPLQGDVGYTKLRADGRLNDELLNNYQIGDTY